MRKFFKYLLPLGLLVLAVIAFMALVAIGAARKPERREDAQQAVLVDTITAKAGPVSFVVRSQGTVGPRTETVLVSEVAGKVVSVSPDFVAGGFFRQGEVLLQIDPSDYEAALKRAEAALASAKATLIDESARSEQALKDWRNLGREGAPSDLVLRKPQLANAEAGVQAAEADVAKARRDLQRTRISVPYDGLVREKRVDVGQYVSPGTQLGVTFAVDTAEIRLPLAGDDLAFLDLPTATESRPERFPAVTLIAEEAGQVKTWEARIIRTEGVLDVNSRVLYVVAQVVDPYGVLGQSDQDELRMGTFVRAGIQGRRIEDAVVLPRHVLRADHTVLVASPERELEIREVQVARAEPEQVIITGGIAGGEQVVTTTLDAPIPGTKLALSGDRETPTGQEPAPDAVAGTGEKP